MVVRGGQYIGNTNKLPSPPSERLERESTHSEDAGVLGSLFVVCLDWRGIDSNTLRLNHLADLCGPDDSAGNRSASVRKLCLVIPKGLGKRTRIPRALGRDSRSA